MPTLALAETAHRKSVCDTEERSAAESALVHSSRLLIKAALFKNAGRSLMGQM